VGASHQLEETTEFTPAFNVDGLIPAIIQDASDKSILMFAWMNSEAFAATRATGLIHFWSRSRKKLWMKGETSGETFRVAAINIDCDQDCLLITVTPEGEGKACHTGRRSCFYRRVDDEKLLFEEAEKKNE
jgi:phosphoribosyl-AMP cyclohydrolase